MPQPAKNPDRSIAYDVVRGLGILLVVWGHVWRGMESSGLLNNPWLFELVDRVVYSFHMPLFFVLSGVFFRTTAPPRSFLQSRLQMVVWPLLLWSWVEGLFLMLAGSLGNRGGISPLEALLYPFPPTSVFWFLFALLFCQLVTYALARLFPGAQIQAVLGLALALLAGRGLGVDFGLLTMFAVHYIYFALGYLQLLPRPQTDAPPARTARGIAIFLAGLAAALSPGLSFLPGMSADLAHPLLKALLATVEVAGFLIFAAALVPARLWAVVASIGQRTMPIYVSHIIFAAAIRVVLLKLGIDNLGLHLALGCAAGVLGPLAMLSVLRRFGISHLAGLERRQKPAGGSRVPLRQVP